MNLIVNQKIIGFFKFDAFITNQFKDRVIIGKKIHNEIEIIIEIYGDYKSNKDLMNWIKENKEKNIF